MKIVIDDMPGVFGSWLANKMGTVYVPGQAQYVGLYDTHKCRILASCMYEDFNGKSLRMHFAAEGRNWMTRDYLWFCFYYPFCQIQAEKVIASIHSTNIEALRGIKHLGFVLEATLKDAAPNGDLMLWTMTKDQCSWLSLKGLKNECSEAASGS